MGELIYAGLLLLITCLVLAYVNANSSVWSIGLILALVLISVVTRVALPVLLVSCLIVGLIIVVIKNDNLRKTFLTKYIFNWFRSQVPSMSSTEQEALEAGGIGWEAELFSGHPDWEKLKQYKPSLSDEEQTFLDGPVNQLCNMIDDWKITNQLHDLPKEVWDYIRQEKFFCMIIPKENGGLGFSAQGHSAVVVKLASRSITAAVTVMVPNSLGPGQLLLEYGTEEQKARYLPRLVSGEDIPCFALTAPEAGSDATGMVDNGVVCRQSFNGEDDVLGIKLNWSKRYITLGPVSTLLGLAFKLYDPEHLLGDVEDIGITLALIPTDTEGVEIGRRHMPGANPFQNGPNWGKDVFIPVDWIIGGTEYAGKGWRMLVECLSEGRGISLPALSVSAAKLACHTTSAYARVRQQFRNPIAKFEGVEEVLARIVGKTYLMEASRQLTLSMLDQHVRPSVATAIVKYHLTEMMRDIINDAMDVHGGKGIMLGPTNYLMRIYQALPISITVEGANILTRNMIIFGQGAMRCHPCLMDEILAVNQGEEGLDKFDETLARHVAHVLVSGARAFVLGLTNTLLCKNNATKRTMSHLSAALAFSTELVLTIVGGQLKRRERVSARLGDALSYLYLGTATIAHFENNGRPEDEKLLVKWAVSYNAYHAQEALYALANNLSCSAGFVLKRVCFPFGRSYKQASDKLDHQITQLVLNPTPVRERLIDGIYFPEEDGQALYDLNKAFNLAVTSEAAEQKIKQARRDGIIANDDLDAALAADVVNSEEAESIRVAIEARMKVIQVDHFAPEEYSGGHI
jgi:acyl-CoA dehydrogenase